MTGETPDEDGLNSADGTGDGDPRRVPDPPSYRGKSCKGCLYYSSRLKSDGHNPVCVGIGRTLPQGPFAFCLCLGILCWNMRIITSISVYQFCYMAKM